MSESLRVWFCFTCVMTSPITCSKPIRTKEWARIQQGDSLHARNFVRSIILQCVSLPRNESEHLPGIDSMGVERKLDLWAMGEDRERLRASLKSTPAYGYQRYFAFWIALPKHPRIPWIEQLIIHNARITSLLEMMATCDHSTSSKSPRRIVILDCPYSKSQGVEIGDYIESGQLVSPHLIGSWLSASFLLLFWSCPLLRDVQSTTARKPLDSNAWLLSRSNGLIW